MTSYEASTLGDIVAADYRAAAVLDAFGLDFCCGGKRTLGEACAVRRIDPGTVGNALDRLRADGAERNGPDASWPADELTRYIERRHHAYVREQAPLITVRLAKLVSVHGERHPELRAVAEHFDEVVAELQMHMMKEEQILFPYIRALSASVERGEAPPANVFGTVRNPIRMMELEHQSAGGELAVIRELTHSYTVPADGCTTYRVAFEQLSAFDRDLRLHIHLENNLLFPRAVALEEAPVNPIQ
jgi:regulator of cell morphogenesis and NO signaling